MKKLKFLVKYGVKKRLVSKAFLIANAVIAVIMIGIMLVPSIMGSVGSQLTKIDDEIVIVNHSTYDEGDKDFTAYIKNYISSYIGAYMMVDNVTYIESDLVPPLDYYTQKHTEDGLVYLYRELIEPSLDPNDVNNYVIKAKVYDTKMNSVLKTALEASLKELNRIKYMLDNNVDNALIIDLVPEYVENPASGGGISELLVGLAPIAVIPLFILITFAVQGIGMEIIDEKSTKAIEIIIASVKPTTHYVAKIASIIIFQIIQMAMILTYALIGLGLNAFVNGVSGGSETWSALLGDIAPMIVPVVSLVFICAILGATLYAILGAFIGSISLNQEDYQQTQTPLMLLMTAGYLGSMLAGLSQSGLLLSIFTYIPFFAPLSIPITYLMGYISLFEAIVGIVVLIASVFVLGLLIAPLYKASILSYDQSKLFKRMKNAYKNAKALEANKRMYEENNLDE
ncbi:ABC transporter permease [Acholeplasma hippikon]|nr:ABC transporter permease [Acholeplasma hippikon]